jgi:hypothetical protein
MKLGMIFSLVSNAFYHFNIMNYLIFQKKTLRDITYLKGKYTGHYPLYIVNGTFIRGRDLNSTSYFFINLNEKILHGNINYTPGE